MKINWGYLLLGIMLVVIVVQGAFLYSRESEVLRAIDPEPVIDAPVPVPKPVPTSNPHSDLVKALESEAGMPLARIAGLIISDEAVRSEPYLDSEGQVTIGVGRSLSTNGISVAELHALVPIPEYRTILEKGTVRNGRVLISDLALAKQVFSKPLTQHDIALLLVDDLKQTKSDAVSVFGADWEQIDTVRQEVIVNLLFNLGLPHFRSFHEFIDAVKKQEWQRAASELLLSEAARRNIARYHRDATVIQTGDERYFEL